MNATTHMERGRFQGVGEIVAFNWHWYVAGAVAILTALTALVVCDWPASFRIGVIMVMVVAVLWSVASLAVSHWVYDRSALREWRWTAAALGTAPRRWGNLHCGLDESSTTLTQLFPGSDGVALDIFDPIEMTEASIARARSMHAGTGATAVDFRHLALPTASLDAAFLLFAAHELRNPQARQDLFGEVRRVLRDSGTVIVAEHLRDFSNFCAFGPGAFHFFGRNEWLRVFAKAGFPPPRESNVTPFVRIFVLRRSP